MATPMTSSLQEVNALQQSYGSAQFDNLQTIKRQFYSFVQYPLAGASVLTFFGNALGNAGTNAQLTNMPKAGSFGQRHFALKAIRTGFFINDTNFFTFNGLNASTLASDFLNGYPYDGVMSLVIGEKIRQQFPVPFLYAPGGNGQPQVKSSGVTSLTLAEAAPNTLLTYVGPAPWVNIATGKTASVNAFRVDPQVIIEAEQNFQVQVSYPNGLVPLIATSVVNDTTNPFYVGVILDGVEIRPVQ